MGCGASKHRRTVLVVSTATTEKGVKSSALFSFQFFVIEP
jgi:hypothetical protein